MNYGLMIGVGIFMALFYLGAIIVKAKMDRA